MKQVEAEKLLGGYATGILTVEERRTLFAAALGHQAIFDALMDEEALRILLADPASKAQLLAALAPAPLKPAQPSKIIPFWRHPGLLSAAAGLILASVAGLAYLRSPDSAPRSFSEEAAKAPVDKALEAPSPVAPPAQATAHADTKVTQAPPARAKILAKEVAIPVQAADAPAPEQRDEAKAQPAYGVPGGVIGGVVGGAMGKVEPARRADGATGVSISAAAASASAAADEAQARRQAFQRADARDNVVKHAKQVQKAEAPRPAAAAVMEVIASPGMVSLMPEPTWTIAPVADGSTRVTITAARGLQVLLLKRGASGVEVLKLQPGKDHQGPGTRWTSLVRLAPGDVLDLYALEGPVPDPAQLPETGPVAGFRARIHPTAKKDPTR